MLEGDWNLFLFVYLLRFQYLSVTFLLINFFFWYKFNRTFFLLKAFSNLLALVSPWNFHTWFNVNFYHVIYCSNYKILLQYVIITILLIKMLQNFLFLLSKLLVSEFIINHLIFVLAMHFLFFNILFFIIFFLL